MNLAPATAVLPVISPFLLIILCALAGVGTILLLPSRREKSDKEDRRGSGAGGGGYPGIDADPIRGRPERSDGGVFLGVCRDCDLLRLAA